MTRLLNRSGWVAAGVLALLLIAALAGAIYAGPLDPPLAGTPAPTGKGQIFSLPYTIGAPGSYVVMGDLTCADCASGGNGITIGANDVTLDLNGFTIRGVPGSGTGISNGGVTRTNVEIRNGSLSSWGSHGIGFGPTGSDIRVTNVDSSGNAHGGIYINACDVALVNNRALNNGWGGIHAGSVVSGCVASSVEIINNQVSGNGSALASDGINVYATTVRVEGNYVSHSTNNGIFVTNDADGQVTHNTVTTSTHSGIWVIGSGAIIEGNQLTHNGTCSGDEQVRVPMPSAGNEVVGNRVSSTTPGCGYYIAAGNVAAPVQPAASATSPDANLEN